MLANTLRSCARYNSSVLFRNHLVPSKNGLYNLRFNSGFRGRSGRFSNKESNNTASVRISDTQKMTAGLAAGGIAGLCVYGLVSGPKESLSAMDKHIMWPDYVKQRIHSTYAYLAGSTAICAATAVKLAGNAAFVSRFSFGIAGPLMMLAASIGCGIVARSIPYPVDGNLFNAKHVAWVAYSASLGAMIAPICLIGGSVVSQALIYTGGIVGGLSLIGVCAPSEKFLQMGGPLAIGLGVVFASSLGAMFANPMGRLGMGLGAISLYGGLLLFSGFLLYDTQKIMKRAETHPYAPYNPQIIPYDPINNSMNILIDSVNIFVRMVAILSGNRRK